MNIEQVNDVLNRAIVFFQSEEIEGLFEAGFTVPTPAQMHQKHGMLLPGEPKKKRAPRKKKMAAPANIDFWLVYLEHKLVRQDMAETKREAKMSGRSNIYRLGHLLGALEKVRSKVKMLGAREDKESIEKFRSAMNKHFIDTSPPIKAVNKAIDKFLTTGKRPLIR